MTKKLKMQWLIDVLNDGIDNRPAGAREASQAMLNRDRGIVLAPTGYGKSGIIFFYIVEKLRKALETGEKLTITLSTPYLNLGEQFYTDMIEVLTNLKSPVITEQNCVFIDNSCRIDQQKGVIPNTQIPKWGMKDLNAAIDNGIELPQFVFVISTHKSYNKLLAQEDNFRLGQLRTLGFTTITIFDESHQIINGMTTKKNDDGTTETVNGNLEDAIKDPIYMDRLDEYADCIFMVSATPPKWQAEWFIAHP